MTKQHSKSKPLYEATRYAWKVSKDRATQAEVVLATVQGVIRGAFVADEWLAAIPEHFPGRPPVRKRLGFVGRDAPPSWGERDP